MIRRRGYLAIVAVMLSVLCACGASGPDAVTPEEAEAIARDAYVWGFPVVMNYKTLYNYAIDEDNPEYKGPLNQVSCEARLFTPEDRAVVTHTAGCTETRRPRRSTPRTSSMPTAARSTHRPRVTP